jgi:hypothetical protein
MRKQARTANTAEQLAGLDLGRRDLLKLTGAGVVAGVMSSRNIMAAPTSGSSTFSDDVRRQKGGCRSEGVTFAPRIKSTRF